MQDNYNEQNIITEFLTPDHTDNIIYLVPISTIDIYAIDNEINENEHVKILFDNIIEQNKMKLKLFLKNLKKNHENNIIININKFFFDIYFRIFIRVNNTYTLFINRLIINIINYNYPNMIQEIITNILNYVGIVYSDEKQITNIISFPSDHWDFIKAIMCYYYRDLTHNYNCNNYINYLNNTKSLNIILPPKSPLCEDINEYPYSKINNVINKHK